MPIHPVKLVLLAAIGLSIARGAFADAKNLSCISDESVHAGKVLRDCEQIREPEPIYFVVEQPVDPNDPPIPIKHGERKGDGGKDHNSHGHDARGGGNTGGPN